MYTSTASEQGVHCEWLRSLDVRVFSREAERFHRRRTFSTDLSQWAGKPFEWCIVKEIIPPRRLHVTSFYHRYVSGCSASIPLNSTDWFAGDKYLSCPDAPTALCPGWVTLLPMHPSILSSPGGASSDYRMVHHICYCAPWLSPVKHLVTLQDEQRGTRLPFEKSNCRPASEPKCARETGKYRDRCLSWRTRCQVSTVSIG